ncbi:MAG: hypothetical protein VW450_08410 [Chloroflexota bacterium]
MEDLRETSVPIHLHVATRLRLASFGAVLGYMGISMRTYREARTMPGFVAGGIRSKWWRKEFWTYTVWESREALDAFLAHRAHGEAVAHARPRLHGPLTTVSWESPEFPEWKEALARLDAASSGFTV